MAETDRAHARGRGGVKWAVIALFLVAGVSPTARADEPGVRLTYERETGAEHCPDARQIRERVAELVGEDRFVDDGTDAVTCVMSSNGGTLFAEIEVRRAGDPSTARRVLRSETDDCADLAESASVVIAMVLTRPEPADRGRGSSTIGQVHELADASEVEAALRGDVKVVAEPVAVATPERTVPFAVASAGALFHTSADVGVMVGAGAGARRGDYSLALELQLESSERTEGASEGAITTETGAIEVVGCRHLGAFSGCGLASFGWIEGTADELTNASSSTTPHFRVGARVAGELDLGGRLAARAYIDVLGALSRTALFIDDERVWASPRGSVAVGIATALRFP